MITTLSSGDVPNIVMSMSVWLSVCWFLSSRITKTTQSNFTKFVCMLPLTMALSSCTSGFVDGASCLFLSGDRTRETTREISTKFCSTIKNGKILIVGCALGEEVCYLRWPCFVMTLGSNRSTMCNCCCCCCCWSVNLYTG